jgi:hypothetical protein
VFRIHIGLYADPVPTVYLNADPGPESQIRADPDPDPGCVIIIKVKYANFFLIFSEIYFILHPKKYVKFTSSSTSTIVNSKTYITVPR